MECFCDSDELNSSGLSSSPYTFKSEMKVSIRNEQHLPSTGDRSCGQQGGSSSEGESVGPFLSKKAYLSPWYSKRQEARTHIHTFLYFHTFVCAKMLSTAKDKLGNAPVFLSPCSFISREEMWTRNMHSSEGGEREWRTLRVGH